MMTIDKGKTKAIVLQSIRYGDNSLIVKMLTEEYGMQSYMIKGVFAKSSKMKAAHFQNMNLLEIVEASNKSSLHFIKDLSLSYFYKTIFNDFKKTSIVIFISELLSKSINESETDKSLFQFIHDSMIWLDNAEENYFNFPIVFAMKLCAFLGFSPNLETYNEGRYFDLLDGNFKTSKDGIYLINNELSKHFYKICLEEIDNPVISINNKTRKELLEAIVTYYKLHVDNNREIRSHEVLHTILS